MTDLSAGEEQWHAWVTQACQAVGVDPADVDVTAIHGLSRDIAHGVARPMAPVGSYILGLAVGTRAARGLAVDQESLSAALRSTFPPGPPEA